MAKTRNHACLCVCMCIYVYGCAQDEPTCMWKSSREYMCADAFIYMLRHKSSGSLLDTHVVCLCAVYTHTSTHMCVCAPRIHVVRCHIVCMHVCMQGHADDSVNIPCMSLYTFVRCACACSLISASTSILTQKKLQYSTN
jgi:hypothetical protein